MILNSNLFFVINCFGFKNENINGLDLLLFGIGSVIIVSLLSVYYSLIAKNGSSNSEFKLDTPIYQTKDILLQENSLELIPLRKVTSVWTKTIIFILIFLVAVTPLFQLLGNDYIL